jgi:5-methylcytosine-specific restriction endonuclease McrA
MPKKGYRQTIEHKKNMSKSLKGKVRTEEMNEKQRMLHLGAKSNFWIDGRSTYERKLWLNRRRAVVKIGNGGFHTQGEWETLKAQYNWTCPACRKQEPDIKLTQDHIVPLTKGGSDNIENIQPLCKSCNSTKHTRIIKYAN